MKPPPPVSKLYEDAHRVLEAEMGRIREKAESGALSDDDVKRLESIVKVARTMYVPMTPMQKAQINLQGDDIVKALKDPALFPKRGPKSTSHIHDHGAVDGE